jgi:hypothetical protein
VSDIPKVAEGGCLTSLTSPWKVLSDIPGRWVSDIPGRWVSDIPPSNPFTRGPFVPRKSRASGHFEHTKRVANASGRCVSDIPY